MPAQGARAWGDKPRPTLDAPTDAIVKVPRTTICGTDLHILKGDVPTVQAGRTLGHEGVGVIEQVGAAVSRFKQGDRVLRPGLTWPRPRDHEGGGGTANSMAALTAAIWAALHCAGVARGLSG